MLPCQLREGTPKLRDCPASSQVASKSWQGTTHGPCKAALHAITRIEYEGPLEGTPLFLGSPKPETAAKYSGVWLGFGAKSFRFRGHNVTVFHEGTSKNALLNPEP